MVRLGLAATQRSSQSTTEPATQSGNTTRSWRRTPSTSPKGTAQVGRYLLDLRRLAQVVLEARVCNSLR